MIWLDMNMYVLINTYTHMYIYICLSAMFDAPFRSNRNCETNCPAKELTLPHRSSDGRAVTPGGANSKCFRALHSSQIIACLHQRNWWKSRWRKALCLGFYCVSFYSRLCDLDNRSLSKRCQAARPQQPPVAFSQHRQTQLAQQHFELQSFRLHNGWRQGNPGHH